VLRPALAETLKRHSLEEMDRAESSFRRNELNPRCRTGWREETFLKNRQMNCCSAGENPGELRR
jgi:hypothetical protein